MSSFAGPLTKLDENSLAPCSPQIIITIMPPLKSKSVFEQKRGANLEGKAARVEDELTWASSMDIASPDVAISHKIKRPY
jgi:hypothetical protein